MIATWGHARSRKLFADDPSTDPDLKYLKTRLLMITSSFAVTGSVDEGFQETETVFSVKERLQIY